MSTPDHLDGALPAWPSPPSAPPPALPPESWDDPAGGPGGKPFNAKVVWRAAQRHWWRILLLWGVASAALMSLAYSRIKPTYLAAALLNVEPGVSLYPGSAANFQGDFPAYLETQAQLVTNTDVLGAALADHGELLGLPLLKHSAEPEAVIRHNLQVGIVPRTHLIHVALSSENQHEAMAIVDAVVEAFIKAAGTWSDLENEGKVSRLQVERGRVEKEIERKREEIRKLTEELGYADVQSSKDLNRVSLDRFKAYADQMTNIRLQRMNEEARLDVLRARLERIAPPAVQVREPSPEQVAEALADVPEYQSLYRERARLKAMVERIQRTTRSGYVDASLVQTRERLRDVDGQLRELHARLMPRVRERLRRQAAEAARAEVTDHGLPVSLEELELRVNSMKAQEEQLQEMLGRLEVENKAAGVKEMELAFSQADLNYNQSLLQTIRGNIQQLEFERRGPTKVNRRGRTHSEGSIGKRMKIMAATPVGVFGAVLALFVLLEISSGRVADPDDLPARVRLDVIGVVPPLPSLRPQRALWGRRDEFKARRELEEFVQSLDHLRVALCSGRHGEGRRCVIVTSACGSEGKTTLSAHLAGRCANAGLSTLLIDADLRHPSLGDLLKVPEGPGLSDALRGEIEPEAAMMVIEAGGGFHLLPAGTLGYDPSRLLQGDRLAELIGRFRQAFDMVIIDCPPVLPVPDALIVGRWTDGAVLAVRHDTSRFPLVERANRRLAAVGVPVLGAVVNGVRTMESSYSYHYFGAGRDRRPPGTAVDLAAGPPA